MQNLNFSHLKSTSNFQVQNALKCLFVAFLIVSFSSTSNRSSALNFNSEFLGVGSACANTDSYATRTFNGTNETLTVSCAFAQEYSTFQNAEAGSVYEFTADNDVWITIRSGSPEGSVLAYGYSPQTAIPSVDGNLYMHYNDGPTCETSNAYCIDATAQCTSCPPYLQPNDNPEDAIPLNCGETLIGSNLYATTSGFPNQNCTTGGSQADVFYSFTAYPGVNYQILNNNVGSSVEYDGVLTVYSGTLDVGLTEIACSDAFSASAIEEVNITVDEITDLLIRTFDWSASAGSFEITMNCTNLNDTPCQAEVLSCNSTIAGTTIGATPSDFYSGACGDGTKPSVFYQLNVEAGYYYSVMVTGASNFDPTVVVHNPETNCSGDFEFAVCANFVHPNGTQEIVGIYVWDYSIPIRYIEVFDWNGNAGEFEVTYTCAIITDCLELGANIGDPCDDGDPDTINDRVTEDCECAGNLPCIMTTAWAEIDMPGTGELITISTSNWSGDFNTINNVFNGDEYTFTATFNSGSDPAYLTIRSGTVDGNTLGSGYSPITVTSDIDGSLFVHISNNEYCDVIGTANITSTVQCVTCDYNCPSIGANIGDPCEDGNPATSGEVINEFCECAVPALANLSGTVNWNANCGDRQIVIGLVNPETGDIVVNSALATLNSDGTYLITGLPTGTFDIYALVEGHLSKGFLNRTLTAGGNTLEMGSFIAGDLNSNNGINITDFSLLNVAFGSSDGDANFNYLADMNCDGNVNIIDVSILNIGFGMVGELP